MPPDKPERELPTSRAFDVSTILFLFAVVIFLYEFLFIPPFISMDSHGDATVLLSEAKRLCEGDLIHRDFVQFITPGRPR